MGNLVVFNGGLMRGQSAHWKLKAATYIEAIYTAPCYRLYSIGDRYPAMLREDARGVSVAAELYYVPDEVWPYIDNIEPPGLYRGPVELADGRMLEGMLGQPPFVAKNGVDISDFGGWADYPFRSSGARIDKDPAELAFDLFVNGTLMRGLKLHQNLKHAPYLGLAIPKHAIASTRSAMSTPACTGWRMTSRAASVCRASYIASPKRSGPSWRPASRRICIAGACCWRMAARSGAFCTRVNWPRDAMWT